MNSDMIKRLQKIAESKIESVWRDVAQKYTVGWGGPLEAIEMRFPHISSAVTNIRSQASSVLPLIIFQTLESPPENTNVAVPYQSGADRYKCRLVTTHELSALESATLSEFAQAIWILLDSHFLPDPRDGAKFESKLIELTDERLFGP